MADAADTADELIRLMLLILLMCLCCWCAHAADGLMRWCCWCPDAADTADELFTANATDTADELIWETKTRPRIPWYVGPPKVGTLPDTPNMLSFAPRKTGCSALLHLTEWLSLAHFGSLWLSQAHSSSLWLTLTLSGSLWLYSWSWFFLLTGRWTDGRRWSTRSSRT